ncbi:hypothetical protein A2U01_0082687, partial [Trifolium medium]|nr:hypothetical protein [Trifolium medium]
FRWIAVFPPPETRNPSRGRFATCADGDRFGSGVSGAPPFGWWWLQPPVRFCGSSSIVSDLGGVV